MFVALAAVAFPVAGQTVQKCVGRGGEITLTSGSCPSGQQQAASYDATPERISPEQARRAAELERWQRAQDAQRANPSASTHWTPSSGQESRHARCEAAKRRRDREIAALGLRRTHADLRRWDDYVYERCK